MATSKSEFDNPWDDPDFVALYLKDVETEENGGLDEGADRDEILARYEKYLRAG